MAFAVTCSFCGRRFVDIDDSLLGQQAKCSCGETVSLDPIWDEKKEGEKNSRIKVATKSKNKNNKGTSKSSGAKRSASAARGRNGGPSNQRTKPRPKQRRVPEGGGQAKSKPAIAGNRRGKDPLPSTDLAPEGQPLAAESQQPANTSTIINNESKAAIPATFDSFDIDDILSGGVDNSPLMPASTRSENRIQQADLLSETSARAPSSIGLVGSILAGLSGVLAGSILLMTSFTDFSGTPLGWIGKAFYGAYTGSFGSGDMSDRAVSLFMGAGWALKLLGVLIGIVSLILLLRVGFHIAAKKQLFGWTRPTLATLGVICLFALMGLLFVQSVHHSELLHGLIDFAGEPLEGLLPDGENKEPFKEIRQQYQAENREFMIGIVSFALLPLLAFGGAITSLFFDEK